MLRRIFFSCKSVSFMCYIVHFFLAERITEEGAWRRVEDTYEMWEVIANCIRRSAKEILSSSRRGGSIMKDVWWWNEEVKEKVKEKKRPTLFL